MTQGGVFGGVFAPNTLIAQGFWGEGVNACLRQAKGLSHLAPNKNTQRENEQESRFTCQKKAEKAAF